MEFKQATISLSSLRPSRLANFYEMLMKGSKCEGFTSNDFLLNHDYSLPIHFYKSSSKSAFSSEEISSISLCFQREASKTPLLDIQDWIKELSVLGARLFEGPRVEPFGTEAWLLDIEDNKFLIFVPLLSDNI